MRRHLPLYFLCQLSNRGVNLKILLKASLIIAVLVQISHAQDLNEYLNQSMQQNQAIMNQYMQQNQALDAQMQQGLQDIVQSNMQNPEVQAAYQQYRNSGGTADFQTFAYQSAATRAFSPEGTAFYNQNERNIQQRDQASLQAYRNNQNMNNAAMQQMHQRNSEIAHYNGNLLNGTTDYTDPTTGNQYNLPHTLQPDSYYYDQGTGQNFYNDPQGNFYRGDGNGWYNQLDPND